MTESVSPSSSPSSHGGSPLQRARIEQGLSLESLAAQIKVTPAKLDALEAGRYQELPDPAFARALAMTVCRALKIDPAPVMATLPAARPVSLAASETREVPFEASKTRLRLNMDRSPSFPWAALWAPRFLAPLLVLLAAVAVYFWPDSIDWPSLRSTPPPSVVVEVPVQPSVGQAAVLPSALPSPPASAVADSLPAPGGESASAPSVTSGDVVAGPTAQGAAAAPISAASALAMPPPKAEGTVVLASTEAAWVEVRDARGRRLLSRQLAAGETVGLDGLAPLSVRVGNATAVRLTYRGDPVELAAFTRNNVARLELK